MKKIITTILLVALCSLGALAQEPQEQSATPADSVQVATDATADAEVAPQDAKSLCRAEWDAGNRAYMEGNFAEALEHYESILGYGLYSAKLYYNLGNAAFKLGHTGEAILFYSKALKIAPSDDDIRYNLAIAEAQTKDKIEVMPEFFLNRYLRTVRNSISCTAWSVLSLIALAVALAYGLVFLLSKRLALRKAGFYGAVVAAIVLVATAWFGIAERHEMLQSEEAVVMASAISVKSSLDISATDLFVLHEGTKVRIVTELEHWYEIVIADGKKGWIDAYSIERI